MTHPTTTEILAVLVDRPAGATTLDVCKELARRLPVGRDGRAIDMSYVAWKLRTLEVSGRLTGRRLDHFECCTWALPAGSFDLGGDDLHAGQNVAAEGGDHGNPSADDSRKDATAGNRDADETDPANDEWMIVEVFGHRRHVGRVREEVRFGATMLRIDVPIIERAVSGHALIALTAAWTTHWYGAAALFSVTLIDELTALEENLRNPARHADSEMPF